jgi:hypothetical protein
MILHAALSYQRDKIAFINKMIPSPTPLTFHPSFFTLKHIRDNPSLCILQLTVEVGV